MKDKQVRELRRGEWGTLTELAKRLRLTPQAVQKWNKVPRHRREAVAKFLVVLRRTQKKYGT